MKRNLLLILFLFVTLGLTAQEKNLDRLMQDRNEYYFTFELNGNDNLQKISKTISVDRVDGNVVTAYANNKQFAEFQKMGYEITLQTPPSMLEEHIMWDGSNRAAYDWDQYPTYSAYESMMQQFATDHPDRCTYMELGTLNSGRKIMVCRINNGQTDGKPKFLYTSTMHGDEVTGMMLMLRLIDELCTSNDARILNLVNNLDIFISPCTNPDGTYYGGNNTVMGATRYNGNGVDLNRHFPDFDDGPHPDGADHYENEAQWMMDLAQEYLFTMSANYHGGAEVMNYPWDTYQPLHADDAWWQLVSHEYADLCHQVSSNYMTDYNNGITNGYAWYTITGSRQDYMNYYGQCREVTIECSNSKTPSASQMPTFWNYNYNSMLAYMEQCFNGIHGIVTDATSGAPVVATITIVGHDHHGSTVTSHMPVGDYYRVIKGGTYTVKFTANGYEPYETSVTVADGQAVELNVQLTALEGIAADFTADVTAVAIGGTVHFTDESWGAQINSWEWEFEGGTPATSTALNPTVTYNEAGTFGVRLTVTNADGESDTKYIPYYISVVEAYNMTNGTITTCDAMFYDDGGPTSNYGNSKDFIMTFFPASDDGYIEAEFQSFDTENNYDFLYIYDGSSTSATQIGQYSGGTSPGTVTATNVEGALTFKFHSDSSVNRDGWAAHIHCIGVVIPLEVSASVEHESIMIGQINRLFSSATGGTSSYTYHWSPADNLDDPTAQNPVFTATEAGEFTYVVTVEDGNETASASVSFVVLDDTDVNEISAEKVMVFPNPASSVISISGLNDASNLEVMIVNLQGQVVMTVANTLEINVKNIESGVYFLNINCNGTKIVKRVVVE